MVIFKQDRTNRSRNEWLSSQSGPFCHIVNLACKYAFDVGYCFGYVKNSDPIDNFPCLDWTTASNMVLFNMRRSWRTIESKWPQLRKEDDSIFGWKVEDCKEFKQMQFSSFQTEPFDDYVSVLDKTLTNC